MCGPDGLAVAADGGLYVNDLFGNRVVYYAPGSTTASQVYGQGGSFTSNTLNNAGVAANTLYRPYNGLALDSNGGLYVSDTTNNRVLHFPAGEHNARPGFWAGGSV